MAEWIDRDIKREWVLNCLRHMQWQEAMAFLCHGSPDLKLDLLQQIQMLLLEWELNPHPS